MGNLQWIFDGIGTEIVVLLIGLFIGGGIGYKIGINKGQQKQVSKDNAKQNQDLRIDSREDNHETVFYKSLKQTQRAGDNDNQIQTGKIVNGNHKRNTKSRR